MPLNKIALGFLLLVMLGCRVTPDPQTLDFGDTLLGVASDYKSAYFVNTHPWKKTRIVGLQTDIPFELEQPSDRYMQTLASKQVSRPIAIRFKANKPGRYERQLHVLSRGVSAASMKLTGNAVYSSQKGIDLYYQSKHLDPSDYVKLPISFDDDDLIYFELELRNESDDVFEGIASLIHQDRRFILQQLPETGKIRVEPHSAEKIQLVFDPGHEGRWHDLLAIREIQGNREAAVVLFCPVMSSSITVKTREQVKQEYIAQELDQLLSL